ARIAEIENNIGSSYTAGDGLTLTGSDFDIDLTDTAIFASDGTGERVVVMPSDGLLRAKGIDAGSETLTLSSDDEVFLSSDVKLNFNAPQMTVGATNNVDIEAGSTALYLNDSSVYLQNGAGESG